jgi:hypothetical protein
MQGQNYFAEANWHVLIFLHPKFAVQCSGGIGVERDSTVSILQR